MRIIIKKTFIILFFFLCSLVCSQNHKVIIAENITKIERALIEKDTIALQRLMHPEVTFGHSNAWIETKTSLVNDLIKSKVVYTDFEKNSPINFTFLSDNTAVTRRDITATGTFREYDFSIKMNVLEVWTLSKDDWLLIARQGVEKQK